MSTGISVLLILIAFTSIGSSRAEGGYRDMKTEFEHYQPPSYLFQSSPPTASERIPPKEVKVEEQRRAVLKSTLTLTKTLYATLDRATFYHQSPNQHQTLGVSSGDVAAVQEVLKDRFSLERLETLTLMRHPGIKAAEKRVQATLEQFSQVTAVDEILRQYSAFTEDMMTGVGPMKKKDAVTMTFPSPGVLALKGQVVNQDVLANLEHLEAVRRDAITLARMHHWRLWFLCQAQAITGKTVGLLKDLEAVAKARFEAGKTSFQDVIKIQVKRELLEEKLQTLREQQRNEKVNIQQLLNMDTDTEVGDPQVNLADAVLPDLPALYRLAVERRQELRRLRARIGKMERMIEMAETMLFPSFTLGLSHYQDEAIKQVGWMAKQPTFSTSPTASRGAGIPKKPWFGVGDAYVREIRQKRLAMQEELKQLEATTIARVRKKWFAVDRAAREKKLYQHTLLQLSQAALDVSTSGYESGKVSFADVIASFTLWLDAHLALAKRQSAYGIGLAELEQAVGQSFTQRQRP